MDQLPVAHRLQFKILSVSHDTIMPSITTHLLNNLALPILSFVRWPNFVGAKSLWV